MKVFVCAQLCTTQAGRENLRKNQVYLILRALDKWETDEGVKRCCMDLIGMLISDDPEPDMQHLDQVVIPQELREQLDRESDQRGTDISSGVWDNGGN